MEFLEYEQMHVDSTYPTNDFLCVEVWSLDTTSVNIYDVYAMYRFARLKDYVLLFYVTKYYQDQSALYKFYNVFRVIHLIPLIHHTQRSGRCEALIEQ